MRTPIRTTAVAVAVAAVAFAPLVAVTPTQAAPSQQRATPSADFTAGVTSINHGLGRVTLSGTAPVGTSIEIAGDVEEPVWTNAKDGTWTAQVRVRLGEHTIRVTSAVSGRVIELPVELLILKAPEMLVAVDGIARTMVIDGVGYPGAHFVIREDGKDLAEADVDADGVWGATLRGLSFGEHHIEAWQYFDGEHNGGVDDVFVVSGAPVVTESSASRESERIVLAGRAPAGSTLTFADQSGPFTRADGEPIAVTVGDDTTWRVELPIPDAARFETITVTGRDGATELGSTRTDVTVPIALTGSVEELADGSVRLAGTGEIGGVVALETESGTPIEGADGQPIATAIGRSWELVVPRDVLPDDVVIARQRVSGVEQGALRLVLPKLPVRPAPEPDPGTGPGVSTGNHPTAQQAAAGRITIGSTKRLAYTGDDPTVPLGVAGAFLALGLGGLVGARFLRRRGAHRG